MLYGSSVSFRHLPSFGSSALVSRTIRVVGKQTQKELRLDILILLYVYIELTTKFETLYFILFSSSQFHSLRKQHSAVSQFLTNKLTRTFMSEKNLVPNLEAKASDGNSHRDSGWNDSDNLRSENIK